MNNIYLKKNEKLTRIRKVLKIKKRREEVKKSFPKTFQEEKVNRNFFCFIYFCFKINYKEREGVQKTNNNKKVE